MKVYDCYRPLRQPSTDPQAADLADQGMKPEFYPRVDRSVLFDGHIAGAFRSRPGQPLDVTLVALPAHPPCRATRVDALRPRDLAHSIDWAPARLHRLPPPSADPARTGDQNRTAARQRPRAPGFVQLRQGMVALTFKPPGGACGHALFQLPSRRPAGPAPASISAACNRCMATVASRPRTSAAPQHPHPGHSRAVGKRHAEPYRSDRLLLQCYSRVKPR